MTTISVLIPTHNREGLIGRALSSVLGQTLACSEILVIDDGSSDRTREVVAAMGKRSVIPITCLHQENRGPAAARNLGIMQARSELLAFLDSDDHWRRDKLARQCRAMEEHPGYLVSHTRELWRRRGVHLNQKKKHLPGHGDIFAHCLQLCAVGMSTVMVRRRLFERVGLFSADLPCCEDYDLWLRVSAEYPFLLIDEPLTIKEGGRQDQVSYRYRVGMDRFRVEALVRLLESGVLTGERRNLAIREMRRKSRVYGLGCIKHGRIEEAMRYLRLSGIAGD